MQNETNRRTHARVRGRVIRDELGWAAALLAALFGIAYGGPALTRLGERRRRARDRIAERVDDLRSRGVELGRRTRRRVRRLGGGSIRR